MNELFEKVFKELTDEQLELYTRFQRGVREVVMITSLIAGISAAVEVSVSNDFKVLQTLFVMTASMFVLAGMIVALTTILENVSTWELQRRQKHK